MIAKMQQEDENNPIYCSRLMFGGRNHLIAMIKIYLHTEDALSESWASLTIIPKSSASYSLRRKKKSVQYQPAYHGVFDCVHQPDYVGPSSQVFQNLNFSLDLLLFHWLKKKMFFLIRLKKKSDVCWSVSALKSADSASSPRRCCSSARLRSTFTSNPRRRLFNHQLWRHATSLLWL